MSAPLLDVQGLEKRFGAVAAAESVSVRLEEGEVVGVIGANGAGKTTFVNLITGHLRPTAGRILLRGRDISRLPSREIARMGIRRSFQIPQLFPEFTVRENLLAAVVLSGERRGGFWLPARDGAAFSRVDELTRRFGLENDRDKPAASLSQGTRKFLDIAMTMVDDHALALLDEPTSGVSAEEKFGVMDRVLSALSKSGSAVMFIEHDMEIVARHARRVLAFSEGRIIADGPPARVLSDSEVRRVVVGEHWGAK